MPNLKVSREFKFSASHFLTNYHGKCENLHGHNYKLIVTIEGPVKTDGMVLDFVELKRIVNDKILVKLDHKHLNEILENPSSENLAVWIWDELNGTFGDATNEVSLKKVDLYETDNCHVEYEGR